MSTALEKNETAIKIQPQLPTIQSITEEKGGEQAAFLSEKKE